MGHSRALSILLHFLLNGTTSERRCEPPERTDSGIWPQTRTGAAGGRSRERWLSET